MSCESCVLLPNEADVHREIDLVQEFARLDIPTAQLAEVPAQQPLKALAGLRPIPARHAPWLACPWALSVNSTWPTFLSPPQVGLVQFTDSSTGTHANYCPGVEPTLTVDSRLTAVPPKPSKLPGHYMARLDEPDRHDLYRSLRQLLHIFHQRTAELRVPVQPWCPLVASNRRLIDLGGHYATEQVTRLTRSSERIAIELDQVLTGAPGWCRPRASRGR